MNKPFLKYIQQDLGDNFLLITTGLPATWKTESAREVVKIKKTPVLRTEIVRPEAPKGETISEEKVAPNIDKRTAVYAEVCRRADETLKTSGSVILVATFITQELRKRAAEIADKNNKTLVILQTDCPREVSTTRILKRSKEKPEANALTEQTYLNNNDKFEKVDLDDIKKAFPKLKILHLVIDTTIGELENLYVKAVHKKL